VDLPNAELKNRTYSSYDKAGAGRPSVNRWTLPRAPPSPPRPSSFCLAQGFLRSKPHRQNRYLPGCLTPLALAPTLSLAVGAEPARKEAELTGKAESRKLKAKTPGQPSAAVWGEVAIFDHLEEGGVSGG